MKIISRLTKKKKTTAKTAKTDSDQRSAKAAKTIRRSGVSSSINGAKNERRNSTRGSASGAGPSTAKDNPMDLRGSKSEGFRSFRFAGVSLAGGKTDKTAVAILEYYPDRKRVFLRTLRDKVGSGIETADQQLFQILTEEEGLLTSVTFDAPLQLPKCVRCDLVCPGVERCKLPEIKWMWQMHTKRSRTKRPNKMFTPYTERCSEIYIANELEEPFHPSHALGSNAAPLAARAHYLVRRLVLPVFEAFPKLTLWRIGLALHIPKSYLRFHKHAVDSDEARLYILKTLMDKEIAFIYQQDLKLMVENGQAFDAFLCALNGFLHHRGQTEDPPSSFPKQESWIEFPKQAIQWF